MVGAFQVAPKSSTKVPRSHRQFSCANKGAHIIGRHINIVEVTNVYK